MTAIGSSGQPSALACACPSVVKAVEQIVRAAGPRLVIATLSWILHDVHEPQSPDPVITKSHCPESSLITVSDAGIAGWGLRRLMTEVTP